MGVCCFVGVFGLDCQKCGCKFGSVMLGVVEVNCCCDVVLFEIEVFVIELCMVYFWDDDYWFYGICVVWVEVWFGGQNFCSIFGYVCRGYLVVKFVVESENRFGVLCKVVRFCVEGVVYLDKCLCLLQSY